MTRAQRDQISTTAPSALHAMTLIELLIVLALLGGLATIALTSMGDLSARNRVDTTRQRLDAIRNAVIGDGINPGRFLADMGRLPRVYDDSNKAEDEEDGYALRELWEDVGMIGYDKVASEALADADGRMNWPDTFPGLPAQVTLYCGWNGPYLLIPGKKLFNGFGSDFRLLLQNSDSLAWTTADPDRQNGETIYGVQSLGLNNDQDMSFPEWLAEDMVREFVNRAENDVPLLPKTTLTVVVMARNATNGTWQTPVGIINPSVPIYDSNTSYNLGDFVLVADSTKQYLFQRRADYTQGLSPPIPPTDSTAWSYCQDITQEPHHYFTHLRMAMFIPEITSTAKTVFWVTTWEKDPPNVVSTFTFTNVVPGIRKLYVYGYLDANDSKQNSYASGPEPQTIDVKPGANFVTVYLTEKLN